MKKIFGFIIATTLVASCTPPEVGYISDNIHAQASTMVVPRGVYTLGALPIVDGSTYPLKWEITSITDKDGNVTNELQEKRDMLIWKKTFDPRTDTTWELAMQKVTLSQQPAILIDENSGQFSFTQNTVKVSGDDFDVSLSAKNVKGERLLKNFMHIKLSAFKPVEFPVASRVDIQFGKANNVWEFDTSTVPATTMTHPADYFLLANAYDDQKTILDGTNNRMTILKKDVEPKLSIKVKMIILDGDGTPIDPSKLVFFPNSGYPGSPGVNLPNFHDNTIGVVVEPDGTTFGLPAPPFPQYSVRYTNPTDPNRFLMYYLSANDAVTFDKAAYEAANPVPAGGWEAFWTPYTDPATNVIRTRLYIRWGIVINDTGTWELKMKIPYCKVK